MRIGLMVLVSAAVLSGGCATSTSVAAQTPPTSTHSRSNCAISTTVSGGRESGRGTAPLISNSQFQLELERALQHAQIFAKSADARCQLRLTAFIGMLKHPGEGVLATVELEVTYSLESAAEVLWSETIISSGTATFSDAFLGLERVRLANEIALHNNVQKALSALAHHI